MASKDNKLVDEFYTLFQSIKDHNQSLIGNFKGLNLPTVCVVGAQSHGKSSVLSNFAQIEVLPTDSGICTKGPIQIRIIYDESVENYEIEVSDELKTSPPTIFYGEGEDVRNDVKNRQMKLIEMTGKPITDKEVRVNIKSSKYKYNLTLIDLPGLIQFDSKDSLMQPIKDLVKIYAEQENSLILVAHEASQNIENNPGLGFIRTYRPNLDNVVIAVTKVDLITDEGQENELKNLFRRTDLGNAKCFMVRNRTSKEKDLSIDEVRSIEMNFFVTSPYYTEFSEKLGVPKLTETLNELQKNEVKNQIPEIEETLSLAARQLKTEVNLTKDAVNRIKTWNDLMNEFHNKLNQAWGGFKVVLSGAPDTNSMLFVENVRHLVGDELDTQIRLIHNEIFKDGRNGWIRDEVNRQIPGASSAADDSRNLDMIAISVSYQVIGRFQEKFRGYVMEFNSMVETFLQNLTDDVFGNYTCLAEIVDNDVMSRKDSHEKRCNESIEEFFKMYQSVNAYNLSLELFHKSKPKQMINQDEEFDNKMIKSLADQVLMKVEAFIEVWSDILKLHMNTYLRYQMVTELIKNIQNNTRSTIDAKLAANEVTNEDLDRNQDDEINFERLKECEEQLERVDMFQKNLANMKRVYKIHAVVVKKKGNVLKKVEKEEDWREVPRINQSEFDGETQYTTNSDGKIKKKNKAQKLMGKIGLKQKKSDD